MITLVLGGARSGKSAVAERLVDGLAGGGPVTYLATGIAGDEDMAARIAEHRARRPAHWRTVETGPDLVAALLRWPGTVLIDALGTWLAALPAMSLDRPPGPLMSPDPAALCQALSGHDGDTVVVSEEVGLGVHPATEAGRRFRDELGALNQAVATVADRVMLVVAGRVLALDDPADLLAPDSGAA